MICTRGEKGRTGREGPFARVTSVIRAFVLLPTDLPTYFFRVIAAVVVLVVVLVFVLVVPVVDSHYAASYIFLFVTDSVV